MARSLRSHEATTHHSTRTCDLAPFGGAVAAGLVARLKNEVNLPATAAEFSYLYPYDKTVWPRGLLPPLAMWVTTHTPELVYVKLSQGNFTFEGTYSVAGRTTVQRKRVRIDETQAARVGSPLTGKVTGVFVELGQRVKAAGYEKWDACAPFPVHGLDKVMGIPATKLPWAQPSSRAAAPWTRHASFLLNGTASIEAVPWIMADSAIPPAP